MALEFQNPSKRWGRTKGRPNPRYFKQCSKCFRIRGILEFSRCNHPDGRMSECKLCKNPKTRRWNRANRARLRVQNRENGRTYRDRTDAAWEAYRKKHGLPIMHPLVRKFDPL